MSRGPLQPARGDHYDRPHGNWNCGDAELGATCPLGPTAQGICLRQFDCQPRLLDGRWFCARPVCFGGPCQLGPTPTGVCGLPPGNCRPQPSLRRRRGAFALAVSGLTIAALLLALSASRRAIVLNPGPLHASHAQILAPAANQPQIAQCSACHAAATQSPAGWLAGWVRSSSAAGPTQSQLCLECHREQLGDDALLAHSVSHASLVPNDSDNAMTQLTSHSATHAQHATHLACVTCHRDHQGAQANLQEFSNQQCAHCHQSDFADFAVSHPEFQDWPNLKSSVAFPHELHERKHFPERNRSFDCQACHARDAQGEIVSTTGYDRCASCHDATIRAGTAAGLQLVAVPMIDLETLKTIHREPIAWPASSQGSFDGTLPPLMQLLLLADAEFAEVWQQLGTDFDLIDFEPSEPAQLQQALTLVKAIQRLTAELSRDPVSCLQHRLTATFGVNLAPHTAEQLLAGLPREFVTSTISHWFADVAPASANPASVAPPSTNSGRVTAPTEESLLLSEDLATAETPSHNVTETEPLVSEPTGWERNPVANYLRYRPIGHADPMLRQLIEQLAIAARRNQDTIVGESIRALWDHHVIRQCTVCHETGVSGAIAWTSKHVALDRPFTRFRHGPHLQQAELLDCRHCHQPPREPSASDHPDTVNSLSRSSFAPISKQTCANCHRPHAAGDACLQCHNYHVNLPMAATR